MFTKVELSENCCIFYEWKTVPIRCYEFEYKNSETGLLFGHTNYTIFFGHDNFKTKFIVKEPYDSEGVKFDTYEEAEQYVLNKCRELKINGDEEVEEIKKFNEKRKKGIKKGKKYGYSK